MPPKRIRVSEGSCWRCKDRRVLCDVKKPTCTRCDAANENCQYGVRLKWANGVAARGRLAGQNLLPLKKPSESPSPTSSPTSPVPRRVLSSIDDWQVPYFTSEVLPRFSLLDGGPGIDPAWLVMDTSIHQAVIAVAHSHRLFRNRAVNEETFAQIKQARFTAIRSLRQRLQDSTVNTSHSITFPCSVLLCMLDGIIEPQEEASAASFHLRGGRAILQQGNHLTDLTSIKSGVLSLLLSVYATMDLTSAILSGEPPHLGPQTWLRSTGSEAWWSGIQDEHAFIDIMALLSQLAQLGHEVHVSGSSAPIRELLEIQLTLGKTESRLLSLAGQGPEIGNDSIEALTVFCSAYRAAARIYMYRALCNLDVSDLLVQESVQEGITALSQAPDIGKLAHCLLFPCLVIGTHCTNPEYQQIVLESLDVASEYLSFGSIKVMENFLKDVWGNDGNRTDFWSMMLPVSGKAFMF